jgi:hypothetical protein
LKTLFLKFFLLLIILNLGSVKLAFAQEAFTIGPMVHFSIGNKFRPAYGLEFSYWNFSHFPYSIDFGIDFEKSKFRIYSEAQTGIGITGISAGPCIEFKKESPIQLGLQGSFWVNYFLGIDFRFRYMRGKDYFAPGLYAKYPWLKGGSGNSSNSSHHHHYDWD